MDNSTDDSQDTELVNRIAYGYVSPIIISFGIFGDLMTIFILLHPVLWKSSVIYSYLIALAVTDLCTLISVIPMILWILDIKLCTFSAAIFYAHIGFPLANALMSSSEWIVVFFTLGQYVAVCHPFSRRLKSRRLCRYLTGAAYLLSFTIYFPWAWKKEIQHNSTDICPYTAKDNRDVISSEGFAIYQWIREAISRVIPFLFVAFFNISILRVYKATNIDRLSRVNWVQKQTLTEKAEQEERRLWMLLMGIITVFFVCTIPAAPLTILVSDEKQKNFEFQVLRAVTNILEFTKFAMNFYFYCMINPDIRSMAVHRLTCRPYTNPKFDRRRQMSRLPSSMQSRGSSGRSNPRRSVQLSARRTTNTSFSASPKDEERTRMITYRHSPSRAASVDYNNHCDSMLFPQENAPLKSQFLDLNASNHLAEDEIQL